MAVMIPADKEARVSPQALGEIKGDIRKLLADADRLERKGMLPDDLKLKLAELAMAQYSGDRVDTPTLSILFTRIAERIRDLNRSAPNDTGKA